MLNRCSTAILRITFALSALLTGFWVYVSARPPDSTHLYWLVNIVRPYLPLWKIPGLLNDILPDFIHPLAFALLTMSIFPAAGRKSRAFICIFWLITNLFFEIGQRYGIRISNIIYSFFPENSMLKMVSDFFLTGTYDLWDMVAICSGTLVAFIIGDLTKKGIIINEKECESNKKTFQPV